MVARYAGFVIVLAFVITALIVWGIPKVVKYFNRKVKKFDKDMIDAENVFSDDAKPKAKSKAQRRPKPKVKKAKPKGKKQ